MESMTPGGSARGRGGWTDLYNCGRQFTLPSLRSTLTEGGCLTVVYSLFWLVATFGNSVATSESILDARIKSFSLRPSMACVEIAISKLR